MGRDNSFGALRLLAALMVTLSHSFPLAIGPGTIEPPYPLLPFSFGTVGVFIFFAISGILVTRSFVNSNSAFRFAWHRFLRIYPGLVVCLLVSAFVVAPFFISDPISYLTSSAPFRFVLVNAPLIRDADTGIIGAFATNPLPNAIVDPIWTLVWEVKAYAILFLLGPILLIRKTWVGLLAILVAVALSTLVVNYAGKEPLFLGAYFLGGLFWYVNRDLRHRPLIALIATAALLLAYKSPVFNLAFTVWIVAIVFSIGTIKTTAFRFFEKFDPTYGLYLYSFPAGQMLASAGVRDPLLLAGLTILGAGACAAASWYAVERPAMRLKDLGYPARTKSPVRAI